MVYHIYNFAFDFIMAKKEKEVKNELPEKNDGKTIKAVIVINDDYTFDIDGKRYEVPEINRKYIEKGKKYGVVIHQFGIDFYLI